MNSPTPPRSADPRRALILGTLWSVGMRWSIKGMGLISTIVLARLLSPADYGVVAMATLVIGLAEVLIDFGANTALLREPNATRDYIDSAWTLCAIQGLVIATILAVVAPLAGRYFQEPRVVWVIWVIAPFFMVSAFVNVGITLARKELNFALEFRYAVAAKVVGMIVTVMAAFVLRDYRALVIGVAAGFLANFFLSFLMHPYRPRWCTASFGAMWHFSKWMLVSGVGQFAIRKIDEVVAGRLGNTDQFGLYTVGADIGQIVTAEIGPPINRTLLPTLSSLQDDPDRMKLATLKTLAAVATLVLPLGVGMALVSVPATLVLLGDKWLAAAPFVALFALIGSLRVLAGPVPTMLLVMGHSKLQATTAWIEFSVFVVAAAVLVPRFGFIGLAYSRLVSAFAIVTIHLATGRLYAGIRIAQMAGAIWRPAVGVALMAVVLPLLASADRAPLLELTLRIAVGATVYIGWIGPSWWLAGRPDGLESMVFDRLTGGRFMRS